MRNQPQPAVALFVGHGPHPHRRLLTLKTYVALTLLAAALLVWLWPAPVVLAGPGAAPQTIGSSITAGTAAVASAAAVSPDSHQTLLLAAINEARRDAGLQPVVFDPVLSEAAAAHAKDMIDNHYFAHVSATDGTPARRAHKAGVPFERLGENLAGNSDLADAHRMLMASPTHRANILAPDFQRVGIAAVQGGPWGYMIVEMFTAPVAPAFAKADSRVAGDAR